VAVLLVAVHDSAKKFTRPLYLLTKAQCKFRQEVRVAPDGLADIPTVFNLRSAILDLVEIHTKKTAFIGSTPFAVHNRITAIYVPDVSQYALK
jgi:hypothetical protein